MVKTMDTAIINTKLITLQGHGLGIIDDGAVAFSHGKISFVGKTSSLDKGEVENIIDGRDHVTMPGLVNAHTHTGLTILRGGAQDVPEIEWMNRALGPIARHLKEKDLVLGAKLGVIEGLRSGITTFGEYTTNIEELIREVYQPFHVRVAATETINEVISDKTKIGPKDVYELDPIKGNISLGKTEKLHREYADTKLVEILYGPQALDMVSPETLDKVKESASKLKAKIHMHVAQGERERLQVKGRYGKGATTVKILDELGMIDDDLIAVHCHDTTENEKRSLVEKGACMVGCPSSISMIDGIVPPVWEFLSLGGTVGLGTDQAPGPGTHNMFREMRTIALLTKTKYRDPTVLPPWQTLRLGSLEGAKVLGLDDTIGTLEEGKSADVITVNLSRPNMTPSVDFPFHNYVANLVYSTTGFEVDNVIIEGKFIIRDGNFVQVDERKVVEEVQDRAVTLFKDATDDWEDSESHLVNVFRKGLL